MTGQSCVTLPSVKTCVTHLLWTFSDFEDVTLELTLHLLYSANVMHHFCRTPETLTAIVKVATMKHFNSMDVKLQ